MKRKCIDNDWETSKRPKPPRKIRAEGIRGLLGVISPSKRMIYVYEGDKEVWTYNTNVTRYLNYKRLTTKKEWRRFYRYMRLKRRVERIMKGREAN